MPKSKIVLTAAVLLLANLAAAAQDARFPNLDTQKLCRNRAKSTEEMMGDKAVSAKTFDTCMRSERAARDALAAAWKDIPPTYKAACVKPSSRQRTPTFHALAPSESGTRPWKNHPLGASATR